MAPQSWRPSQRPQAIWLRSGTLKYRRSRAQQRHMMLEDGVEFFRGTPKLRWGGSFGSKTMKRRLRAALQWEVMPFPKRPTKNEQQSSEHF